MSYIVGITGGSASGKTTFFRKLLSSFNEDELCLLSQDNYYKDKDEQELDENGVVNFDLPRCINSEEFARDITALRSGNEVHKKEYTFNNPNVVPKDLVFKPAPIILVEGIFVFYHTEIFKQLDLKIFVDAKEHVKLQRRIIRDKMERGYDLDDVLYRYTHHVAPTYEKYIEPYKNSADIVIPNNKKFDKALEVVISHLKTVL